LARDFGFARDEAAFPFLAALFGALFFDFFAVARFFFAPAFVVLANGSSLPVVKTSGTP
jgi:hypothetical protein